jgi:hypothetical protein
LQHPHLIENPLALYTRLKKMNWTNQQIDKLKDKQSIYEKPQYPANKVYIPNSTVIKNHSLLNKFLFFQL